MVGGMVGRMVVMMIVMAFRGEGRGGKDHQQQNGCENLFHGSNVAQEGLWRKGIQRGASREERVTLGVP
jgi:hypothetical protein